MAEQEDYFDFNIPEAEYAPVNLDPADLDRRYNLETIYETTRPPAEFHSWTDFDNSLQAIARAKGQLKGAKRMEKLSGGRWRAPTNPYVGYRPEGVYKLAELVGNKNYGLSFKPEWNAVPTANQWIGERIRKSYGPEREKWRKWGVREGDLDNDPDTPHNVIVYSDVNAGKVRAIDGFQIKPPQKKMALRAVYTAVPDKDYRSSLMKSDLRKALKAYYRKYPTPEEQQKVTFDQFKSQMKPSAFELIKKWLTKILNESGITMYTKTRPDGLFTLTHYMTIIQKATSYVKKIIERNIFNLPANYNYEVDPDEILTKKNQKTLADRIQQPVTDSEGQSGPMGALLIINNAPDVLSFIARRLIPEINIKAGRDVIVYDGTKFNDTDKTAPARARKTYVEGAPELQAYEHQRWHPVVTRPRPKQNRVNPYTGGVIKEVGSADYYVGRTPKKFSEVNLADISMDTSSDPLLTPQGVVKGTRGGGKGKRGGKSKLIASSVVPESDEAIVLSDEEEEGMEKE